MMVSVLYGLLTRIPLYLVKERGFDVMSMGFVASMPCIGGFIGAIGGGWISDKVLGRRRKPTMMFTAISTVVMMLIMLNIPASTGGMCWVILRRFMPEYWLARIHSIRYGGFGYENVSHCLFYYQ